MMGKENQVSGDIGERRERHGEENNRVVRASEANGRDGDDGFE
jgi:hypothetical protein